MSTDSELLVRRHGRAGHITLNRPEALNALTHGMVHALEAALLQWADDDAIDLVILDGAGDRALCAGGDIAAMYHAGVAREYDQVRKFWREEYRLNHLIAQYKKPYVAMMSGFVMGGGVGVSGHASHRIVSDDTQLAMPECVIGLLPDVGGTHLLSQAPGFLGEYLGLTGARMNAADAIYTGFADVMVPRAALPALTQALCESGDVAQIQAYSVAAGAPSLAEHRQDIDHVFGAANIQEVAQRLFDCSAHWARFAQKLFAKGAPLSQAVTMEAIRRARRAPGLLNALRTEYRFVSRCMNDAEFLEGVRALIIDKDKKPNWKIKNIKDVTQVHIDALLSEAVGGDLTL